MEGELLRELARRERPDPAAAFRAIQAFCTRGGLRAPSRASVYAAVDRVEPPFYAAAELPEPVRRCLHNVDGARVPGDQVVFAAFNYGDTRALSFASAMPWACLRRAARRSGFRPKSLALLRAVLQVRGI